MGNTNWSLHFFSLSLLLCSSSPPPPPLTHLSCVHFHEALSSPHSHQYPFRFHHFTSRSSPPMGKYMKKSKITADFAVMDVSPHYSLGVRTRAKTLALQRLQSPPDASASAFSYLQLRSRRLEKLPPPIPSSPRKHHHHHHHHNHNQSAPGSRSVLGESPNPKSGAGSRLRLSSAESGSFRSVSIGGEEKREMEGRFGEEKSETEDFGIEVSLGENNLDFEARERGARESTPCSLIRDPNAVSTPGSTTRRSGSGAANRRLRSDVQRAIPTSLEMEEFFACAEQQQQRLFMEKYNFDVVNDLPLSGRYDWVQLTP